MKAMIVLEAEGDVKKHHNFGARQTCLFQVLGDSFYHRDTRRLYHTDEENTGRDQKGCVWYSGNYAIVPGFRGVDSSKLPFSDEIKRALQKHPIAKPKYTIPRNSVRKIIEAFRDLESFDTRNVTVEELESRS